MIEVKGLTKKYSERAVVDNVSLTIEKNKITSFIGPNGAGKSTLLGMVSRLINSDSGEVFIEGKALKDWNTNELSKKISILKQSNHVDLRLSIRELVSFGRFPYSKGNLNSEDEKQIDLALDYMKLTDIQDKLIHQLSGGQRQRAYIAMVIAQNTEYILLDEPLNNLDMKHAVDIMKILKWLVEVLGKTVLIVIHDINFASCYSDHIVAMNHGKLVKHGHVDSIIDEKLLTGIYELDFNIQQINNKRICVYF